jgi:predicted nucleic acid-binding protein
VSPYFDSAILVKLYLPEPNSKDAASWVARAGAPVALNSLQANEVRNAIRLKLCRGEITPPEAQAALRRFAADIADGLFEHPGVDWPEVWAKAEWLSGRHAASLNSRTLDTLHVALALVLGVGRFVSLDQRQRALADRAGLHVAP